MAAPMMSQRSGWNLSTAMPQASEPATKIPPYAARMRPKLRVGLQRGDEPVGAEGEDAGADPEHAAVLAHALPDQPGATDLGDGRDGEQEQRSAAGSWAASLAGSRAADAALCQSAAPGGEPVGPPTAWTATVSRRAHPAVVARTRRRIQQPPPRTRSLADAVVPLG